VITKRLAATTLAVLALIFHGGKTVAEDKAPTTPTTPIIDYQNRFVPTIARNGMVVGPEKLAAEVGLSILRDGGNAVDAAVATGFALAVTFPRAGNLGGGGFMMIHNAASNEQTLIDYRETAPAKAGRDMFLDDKGELDRGKAYFSHQSSGVPGTVAGLVYALEKYGSMSLREVMAPAIRLADKGFAVSYALNYEIGSRAEGLKKNVEASKLFFKSDGGAYNIGDKWRQPDLAWTLKQIARKGAKGFYQGKVAARIVEEMEANDGLITAEDLATYRAIERSPVRGTYREYDIVSTGPPSSGGIHIIQMLNILEGFDLKSMGHNSAAYLHHLTESMKLAYADRSQYLADTDYYPTPVERLIDKSYAGVQRKRINPEHATPAAEIAPGRDLKTESMDTTHYTVADKDGNVVSNTYTLNFSFGSHIAVPGTGMLLNNEMADFATKPGQPNPFGLVEGEANRIEGGKRPLSSMSPTMVFKDGKPWLTTGSPGGSTIITSILQTLLNAMEFDMNIAAAAAAARVHHQWQPDSLMVESGVSPDTLKLLENMGHSIRIGNRTLGRTNSIVQQGDWLYGATDTRRPGGWVAGY
jgi:gamma-glutamyltranspeptidase/glutathione hydrolase